MNKSLLTILIIISFLFAIPGVNFASVPTQPTITTTQADIPNVCLGSDNTIVIHADYAGIETLEWDDPSVFGLNTFPSNFTKVVSGDKTTCTLTFSSLSAGTYGFNIRVFETGGAEDEDTKGFTFTVYDYPAAYSVSGGGSRCPDGSSLSVNLADSENDVEYELYLAGVATGQILAGTGSAISFTNIQAAGSYTIKGTRGAICTSDMNGSATISLYPVPTPVITGENAVCAGDQKTYQTTNVSGHTYSWTVTGGAFNGGSTGNSVTIDWGSGSSGSLQITETITSTGCQATATYNVTIYSLPIPAISGDNSVCAGDQEIYSTPNVTGHTYSWTVSGGTINGSSNANAVTVDWGDGIPPGSVGITETITSNGCELSTAAYNVTINPPPNVYNLSGSATTNFALDGSDLSVPKTIYTLYRDGTAMAFIDGTGSSISFGLFTEAGTYRAKAIHTGTQCESDMNNFITIPGSPIGIDGMFVLDVSGSMGGTADPSCTSGCKTKMEVLINSAIKTANAWLSWNESNPLINDRVGVTLFRTNAVPSNFAGSALIDVDMYNIPTVTGYIGTLSASGATSMGAGLLSAQNNMTDASRPRNIILFTDGMQNTDPMVIKTPTGPNPADYSLSIGTTATPLNPVIRIFPIGITSPVSHYQLLEDIASKSQGTSFLSYHIEDDLTNDMISSLLLAMKEYCPQMVASTKGNLSGGQLTETIELDNYKPRIAFIVNGFDTDETDLAIEIKKDDDILTSYGTVTDLGDFKMFVMELPVVHEGRLIHSGGEWEIQITGPEDKKYGLITIVDENQLDYSCNILPSERKAGDPIELETEILFKGAPLYDNINVEAFIAKPGEDLGNIMSTRSVLSFAADRKYILRKDYRYLKRYKDALLTQDAISLADRKLAIMMESRLVMELLAAETNKVTLSHDGQGHFSGSFSDTDVTGPYQVMFKISGELPGMGAFQRIEMHSTVRGFGDPDLGNSNVTHIPQFFCLPSRILVRPANKFGNFIGPGYGQTIQASTATGPATAIIDNLDGSYSLVFKDQRLEPSTAIRITIDGKTLFSGNISEISNKLPLDARLLRWRAKAR